MIPELKPEILSEIFEYLLGPLPKRHADYVFDRSFMRQPDLSALLQVSKTIYNIAAPILYRVVVSDDLGLLLLGGSKNQHIQGIIPKSELLGQIRRLFIEYRVLDTYGRKGVNRKVQEKGESKLSKRELERRERDKSEDRWARKIVGVHMDVEVKCHARGVMIQVLKEIKMLQGAMRELVGYPVRRKKPLFERLEKFSVGAFVGRKHEPPFFFMDEEYEELEQALLEKIHQDKEYQKVSSEVREHFTTFVAQTPSIKHFCQSPTNAALSLGKPNSYLPRENDTRPSISFHTDTRYISSLPTAIGIPFTQYVHSMQWVNAQNDTLFQDIENSHLEAVENRKVFFEDLGVEGRKSVPSWDIEYHIYRSSLLPIPM